MKKLTQALLAFMLFFQWANTFGQSLGTYPNTEIISGQHFTVIPSVPPTGVEYLFAYTNTNFNGIFSVNPSTGIVSVTNALTSGTYLVTVKAFGQSTSTQNFLLTVNNPICSEAEFSDNGNLGVFYNPSDIAVGDFNNDGLQDFITSDYSAPLYSIGLGNGRGGFSGYISPKCSTGCQYIGVMNVAVHDLNGDGYQDAIFSRYHFLGGYYMAIKWGNYIAGVTKIPHYSDYDYTNRDIQLMFNNKGDFNNDGFPDLVTKDYRTNNIYILFGNVAGQNIPPTIIEQPYSFYSSKVGDFNGDGNQDIAILVSSSVHIKLGDGLGGFSNGASVAVGSSPNDLVIGDFNSDGHQDLATSNGSNTLSVRIGDGLGGFSGNTEVALVASGGAAAIDDFNGDGKLDLAINHSSVNKVSIVLGDGLGGFKSHKQVDVGERSNSLAVGDFNGDGIHDFATSNFNGSIAGTGDVSIRFGIPKLPMSATLQGNGINIINGDYAPSASDHTDFGGVLIDSNATRSFTIQHTAASPISIISIKSNKPHFVVDSIPTQIGMESSVQFTITFSPLAESVENATISILFGDCMGFYKFGVRGTSPTPVLGTYSNTIIMAGQNTTITPSHAPTFTKSAVAFSQPDFTGLLTVNPTSGKVHISNAKQAGVYQVSVKAFGIDTITQNFTLTVTNPACSDGLFGKGVKGAVGMHPSYVAIGDFNNDGKQDLAIANSGVKTVSIRLGDGVGGFAGSGEIPVGFNPSSIAIGDFNGDGFQDFAAANFDSDNVSIKLGDGLGGFSGSVLLDVGDGPFSIAIGDFNADGKQDFVTANRWAKNITVRLGDGNGGFGSGTNFAVGTAPNCVAIGDFNGDGKQDLVTANKNSNSVSILLGNGWGGFSSIYQLGAGANPSFVAIGDFNNDGNQDLVVANGGSNNTVIKLGNGSGYFMNGATVEIFTSQVAIVVGDFNGDGNQDFASLQAMNVPYLRTWLGDGTGGFVVGSGLYIDGNMALSIAMGDFNHDGIHDFATANRDSQNFSTVIGKNAEAGTNTWLGISADWNIPGNWSTGKVPGRCTEVVVNAGVPFFPIVAGINNTCFSLLLNNGATILMEKDAKLTIIGNKQMVSEFAIDGTIH